MNKILLGILLIQTTVWSGTGSSSTSGSASTNTVSSRQWVFLMGDSIVCCYTWPALMSNLVTPAPGLIVNVGISGWTTQNQVDNIAATLAKTSVTTVPQVVINSTVNDFASIGVGGFEATWKVNYLTIIDALRVKWTNCPIYITRPWMRDNDSQADIMAGWIDYIVTQRSNVHLGTDERVFYKGNDNGATNTTDGIHPSAAGNIAIANAQAAVLWP